MLPDFKVFMLRHESLICFGLVRARNFSPCATVYSSLSAHFRHVRAFASRKALRTFAEKFLIVRFTMPSANSARSNWYNFSGWIGLVSSRAFGGRAGMVALTYVKAERGLSHSESLPRWGKRASLRESKTSQPSPEVFR